MNEKNYNFNRSVEWFDNDSIANKSVEGSSSEKFIFSDFFEKQELINLSIVFFSLILFFFIFYKIVKKFFYKKHTHLYKYRIKTPENHRAITIGYIVDNKLQKKDIAGAIVQLYIEKYLNINYEEEDIVKNKKIDAYLKKTFPFLIKKSWVIERTLKFDDNLLNSEKLVLEYLFYSENGDRKIRLSEIKGRPKNNKIFRKIEKEVVEELQDFKYRNENKGSNVVRIIIKHSVFILIFIITTLLFMKIANFKDFNYVILYSVYMFSILSIIYLFFHKLEKLTNMTNIGNKILRETLGYRLYLEKVFRDRTNFFDILEKDREELSRDIPYLISFGINNRFEKLVKSLEYDTEDKKELNALIKKIIFWPIFILISAFLLYFYLKSKNLI